MRRLLAAAAVLGLTACINDSIGIAGTQATGSDPLSSNGVAGAYTLRTVGGANLPFTMAQTGADKVEVLDDVFTLTSTNGFSELTHYRRTVAGVVTLSTGASVGSYTRSGTGDITFTTPDVPSLTGTVGGGTLTLQYRNVVGVLVPAVFTK
jgi:hypothetical protein